MRAISSSSTDFGAAGRITTIPQGGWDAENARILLDFLKGPPADGHMQFREEGSDEMVVLPIVALERTARSRALLMLRELRPVDTATLDERDRILTVYPAPP